MKILLIGTGYVGSALLSSWKTPTDLFTATTTTETRLEEISQQRNNTTPLILKLEKELDLSELIDEHDTLIITIAPTKKASYRETYLDSAKVIKDSLAKRKKPLYLIYTSSTSVYGDQQGNEVDEEGTRNPSSENGQLLCKAEDYYLSLENQIITSCILRLAGIHGPGRTLESRALRLSGKELPGTGQEPTNHIHLHDITRAIEYCITHKLKGIYNLAYDKHPTRQQLYNQICADLKIPPPIWTMEGSSSRPTNAIISSKKIKESGFELLTIFN